jgi:two-component system, chemotaxis family, sensor kinase CheA
MSEELEIFLEDCEDQLQNMENALVEMQDTGASEDSIGAIFRAMHTIKGSAGMFGFDNIVKFAHTGENLLGCAREGTIEVTPEMVDLFLLCKDHVEKLITAETAEQTIDEDEKIVGVDLIEQLLSHMPQTEAKEKKPDSPETNVITPSPSTIETPKVETVSTQEPIEENNLSNEIDDTSPKWHISIRFEKDFFTTGMSIHSIFNFLNKMGKILINHPILYHIPTLEEMNPLHPYIGFEILFQANVSKDEIEEVFEFVEDDIDLVIFDPLELSNIDALITHRQEIQLQASLINAGIFSAESFSTVAVETPTIISTPQVDVNSTQKVQTEASVEPVKPEVSKTPIPEPKSIPKNEKASAPKEEQPKKKTSSSLRVDATKIDLLINQMSEIVIANSKILTLVEQEDNTELEEAANRMRELLEYVRDGIMDIRMIQVGDSFTKFRRIVNDTAKKIGKDVDFVISGGDTELDKTVVERISDPLVHMLRNSIDHGVEMPEERLAQGKTAKGRVDLRAYPDSGTIVIEIQDNGKGLDKDRILAKAIENGQVDPNDRLSDPEIYKLIFAAGLSTADKVSDISGRGVGMDVVRRNIEDLRGTIDIDSTMGQGSKITIRLPLTLAIIDGFLVQVGQTKYIIPLESIQECIELTQKEQKNMKGNEFINLRGEMLPIMDVRAVLNEEPSSSRRQNIVIVHFGDKMIGLLVDELLGEHQTVIKSLGEVFANVPGISGGSILGSGEVALIFDIARLIEYKK